RSSATVPFARGLTEASRLGTIRPVTRTRPSSSRSRGATTRTPSATSAASAGRLTLLLALEQPARARRGRRSKRRIGSIRLGRRTAVRKFRTGVIATENRASTRSVTSVPSGSAHPLDDADGENSLVTGRFRRGGTKAREQHVQRPGDALFEPALLRIEEPLGEEGPADPGEHQRHVLGGVSTELLRPGVLAQESGERVHAAFVELAEVRRVAAAQVQEPGDLPALEGDLVLALEEDEELVAQREAGGNGLLEDREALAEDQLAQARQDRLLALEVAVERGGGVARLLGDLLHRHGLVAVPCEGARCRLQDVLAGARDLPLPARSDRHAGRISIRFIERGFSRPPGACQTRSPRPARSRVSTTLRTSWARSRRQTRSASSVSTTMRSSHPTRAMGLPGRAQTTLRRESMAKASPLTTFPAASAATISSSAAKVPRSDQPQSQGTTAIRALFSMTA